MPSGVLSGHTENVKRWAEQCEIDWFTYFIKAWIPFNAYYENAFEENNDRAILNAMRSGNNSVRSKTVELLRQTDADGDAFRQSIGELQRLLSASGLKNRGRAISFESCYLGANPLTRDGGTRSGMEYLVERKRANMPPKEVHCEIKRGNGSIYFTHTQTQHDVTELRTLPSVLRLSEPQRATLIGYYLKIQPERIENLLDTGRGQLNMGGINFCDDRELIFEGLLEVLYALRCLLFHGEIVPSDSHNPVYQPAYFILRRIIKFVL